ncbi:hypothetical protein AFCA_004352 [Aspergillus flavus]|uniref:BTB domain-containing protein n=1 Tax=Aspergillus oryzae (strain 3.042) TaxID=1160506 RepID=I8IQD8_ASPO3|nr:hypothetical protein Ao3042_01868 [Aspergillus oryzae 3.042]KDE76614.1 hypothetical protein AO1008_02430 [Aspergillus oryzae 100-8]UDD56830.1 hypothetical protein AFCA_004352 [Aspergillus flavus]|eukprot:EIT81581.1 hypothetical protein Ao3042_01868 [Aspergillus oryzae 3.042]
MDEVIYTLDPEGDIFLVLDNVTENLPGSLWDIEDSTLAGFPNSSMHPEPLPEHTEDIGNSEEENRAVEVDYREDTDQSVNLPKDRQHVEQHLRIRASSKHLTLACPQFKRTLQPGFQEGNELKSKGYLEIPVQDWPALPFLIVAMIIHGRTRTVPRKVSLERLAEIAVIVDYYECYEAVEIFSDMWINTLAERPMESVSDAEKWLFISWAFQQDTIFESSSKYLQLRYTTNMATIPYPIPSSVRDAIDTSREKAIERVVECMHDLLSRLQSRTIQCCYECDCMLLGALTKQMCEMDILFPRPKSDFPGVCFTGLASQCRNMESPRWYRKKGYSAHTCDLSSSLTPLVESLEDSLTGLHISSFVQLRRSRHLK